MSKKTEQDETPTTKSGTETSAGASTSKKPPKKHRRFDEADKLKNVFYDIRGPVSTTAEEMERDGHTILKLNTGNPAIFGFEAPDVIMRDMIAALPTSQGYTTSKGIIPARRAIVTRYEMVDDFPPFDICLLYTSPSPRDRG